MKHDKLFSTNVYLIDDVIDKNSLSVIKKDIISTIQIFEPRVQVLNLDVKVDPDYNRLGVKLEFKIRNTNEVAEFSTTLRRLR